MAMSLWDFKSACMQKPDGDNTEYCRSCRGEGCRDCRGWGWGLKPDGCTLSATGRYCGDCSVRSGCQA